MIHICILTKIRSDHFIIFIYLLYKYKVCTNTYTFLKSKEPRYDSEEEMLHNKKKKDHNKKQDQSSESEEDSYKSNQEPKEKKRKERSKSKDEKGDRYSRHRSHIEEDKEDQQQKKKGKSSGQHSSKKKNESSSEEDKSSHKSNKNSKIKREKEALSSSEVEDEREQYKSRKKTDKQHLSKKKKNNSASESESEEENSKNKRYKSKKDYEKRHSSKKKFNDSASESESEEENSKKKQNKSSQQKDKRTKHSKKNESASESDQERKYTTTPQKRKMRPDKANREELQQENHKQEEKETTNSSDSKQKNLEKADEGTPKRQRNTYVFTLVKKSTDIPRYVENFDKLLSEYELDQKNDDNAVSELLEACLMIIRNNNFKKAHQKTLDNALNKIKSGSATAFLKGFQFKTQQLLDMNSKDLGYLIIEIVKRCAEKMLLDNGNSLYIVKATPKRQKISSSTTEDDESQYGPVIYNAQTRRPDIDLKKKSELKDTLFSEFIQYGTWEAITQLYKGLADKILERIKDVTVSEEEREDLSTMYALWTAFNKQNTSLARIVSDMMKNGLPSGEGHAPSKKNLANCWKNVLTFISTFIKRIIGFRFDLAETDNECLVTNNKTKIGQDFTLVLEIKGEKNTDPSYWIYKNISARWKDFFFSLLMLIKQSEVVGDYVTNTILRDYKGDKNDDKSLVAFLLNCEEQWRKLFESFHTAYNILISHLPDDLANDLINGQDPIHTGWFN